MNETTSGQAPPFELGLVLAGAVSAGAYTAGVMDMLLEALGAWEDARTAGAPVPPHAVELRVVAGASAGGMTAAITASALGETIPAAPRDPDTEPSGNRFYRAWVQDIDARHLLGTGDLARPDCAARSALDSSVLDRICADALRPCSGPAPARPYVADPLEIILTVANLQGVPYKIAFTGGTDRGLPIVLHADHTRFHRGSARPAGEGWWLDAADPGGESWRRLGEAALATGAFPLGLMPRHLTRPRGDYAAMRWRIPGVGGGGPCYTEECIPPAWPVDAGASPEFPFLAVDGGLIDNEPLELARRALAGSDPCNPRTPDRAHRAVVMVDPFANEGWSGRVPASEGYDMIDVFNLMLGTLVEQARFKPDELSLARNENIYSRFLLTPTRSLGGGQAPHPIASGLLHGFGGFLCRRFRNHDFHLGRRNGQRFLQRYFALPLEAARANPVFAGTDEDTFRRFAFTRDGRDLYPIVPLCGPAAVPVERLPWAGVRATEPELRELERLLAGRIGAVLGRLAARRVRSPLVRAGARTAVRWKRKGWARDLMDQVRGALEVYSLGPR